MSDPIFLLVSSVASGDASGIKEAVRAGADPFFQDYTGETLLMLAVRKKKHTLISILICDVGISPALCNHEGNNALHIALMDRAVFIAEELLCHMDRASVNTHNEAGDTPYSIAVKKGLWRVALSLHSAGAEDHVPSSNGNVMRADRVREIVETHSHHPSWNQMPMVF